ncbi:MAG: hypothetical protein IJB74_00335 [Clostridia bacterium]|nr:hypothetical protein [Clostridia bacterium]
MTQSTADMNSTVNNSTTVSINATRIETIKKLINNKPTNCTVAGRTFKINPDTFVPVLYVGGRRCGKTTIMASIYDNAIFSSAAGNGLKIVACDKNMEDKLAKNVKDLKDKAEAGVLEIGGISPTPNVDYYDFVVYNTKDTAEDACILLRFIDVCGEIYQDATEEQRVQLAEIVHDTKIILVAVDSVSLMESEETAENYYDFNTISDIEGVFKNLKKGDERKLVLFVPVKCEKYYIENKASDLITNIETKYSGVISAISKNSPSDAVAITPVQTVGILEFSKYLHATEDAISSQQQFVKNWDLMGDLGNYAPLCCDQVLWYIFRFIYRDADVPYQEEVNVKKSIFKSILKGVFTGNLFASIVEIFKTVKESDKKSYKTIKAIYEYELGKELYNSTKILTQEQYNDIKRWHPVNGVLGNRSEFGYKVIRDESNIF